MTRTPVWMAVESEIGSLPSAANFLQVLIYVKRVLISVGGHQGLLMWVMLAAGWWSSISSYVYQRCFRSCCVDTDA